MFGINFHFWLSSWMVGTQSETGHHTVISVLHYSSKISTVGALNEQKTLVWFHVPPLSQTLGNECISGSLQMGLRL